MADSTHAGGTRFGRTVVVPGLGEVHEQPVDAIIHAANCRGLLGTPGVGLARLVGGSDVEREAMQQAPLELGSAVVTGSGQLRDRGIRAVIHAVVHPTLGAPARLATVRRATAASLRAAEAHRLRAVAMPILGSGRGPEHPDHGALTNAIVEEIVAHLRRSPARLERVLLVSRLPAETATVAAAVAIARQQSWSSIP